MPAGMLACGERGHAFGVRRVRRVPACLPSHARDEGVAPGGPAAAPPPEEVGPGALLDLAALAKQQAAQGEVVIARISLPRCLFFRNGGRGRRNARSRVRQKKSERARRARNLRGRVW